MPSNRSATPEPLPENRQLLNQQAKRLLAQTGDPPTPDKLYLLQLAQWGLLEADDLEVDPRLRDDLEDALARLLAGPQARAWKWLVYPDGPREPRLAPADLRNLTPSQAAGQVIQTLHNRLAATFPAYPPQPANLAV